MGTQCEVQLYSPEAEQAADAVVRDVARLEAKYSRYLESSFLSAINRVAAQGGALEVDEETAHLLDYAETCWQQSEGLFDISSGVLRRVWDFRSGKLPAPESIGEILEVVGWQRLHWRKPRLEFSTAGMELDLGGVVKEYAADRAATICMQHDVAHGLINLGGDIRIIGPHPDGSPWLVGITNPQQTGAPVQTLELFRGALASSGDYERCMTIDGKRYGHVLNPLTGWPVSGMAAVSVLADFCVVAGSASTIGMLKGADGPDWLAALGLPYLWVDTAGNSGGTLLDT
jgi:thiamine biosynthesis lipoprotein